LTAKKIIKKINRPYYSAFSVKALFIISVFTTGISGFVQCDAQSVVGKWTRTFTKNFMLDKATGKQVPVSAEQQKQFEDAIAERGYKETLELKSDNSYISTVATKGVSPTSHSGKYSLSGNILDMNIPLVQGQKTTITIHSLTATQMVWDLVFMGKLTEIFYTRI
jgi:hypothetical protein